MSIFRKIKRAYFGIRYYYHKDSTQAYAKLLSTGNGWAGDAERCDKHLKKALYYRGKLQNV